MVLRLPKQIVQLLTVLAAAVILLLSVFAGAKTGQNQAQSAVVLSNARELIGGLNYFYSDQDRYPSAVEFVSDKNLMLNYFSSFPPADIISAQCPQSYSYLRPTPLTFKLNFCLPAKSGVFNAGWNQLTQNN